MKKFILSFLSVFIISAAYAQSTTSSVAGSVNVAGATVVVEHEPTGSTKTSVTNDSGNFNFSGLRPGGPYTITVSNTGFQTETLSNVYLVLEDTATFRVTLIGSDTVEDVTVVGTRSGILEIGPGSTITSDDLEAIASIERSFGDVLKRDSRIAVQGSFRDTEISARGVNPRFNNFTIDGVAANDPMGLADNGFASVRNPISLETIAQIRLDFAPFSVTKGNSSGVNISAVTKSGTNEFKGKVYAYDFDESQVGDVDGEPVNQFSDETFGFIFGGPIIKDKLFFFVGYEESERLAPLNARPVDAADAAELQQISDFLMSRYSYDTGGLGFNLPAETYEDTLIKLDYTLNENNRFEYTYQETADLNIRSGIGRDSTNYNFQASYYQYPIDREKATLSYYGDLSDQLSVEAKFTTVDYYNDNDSLGGEDFGHHRIRLSSGAYAYPTGDQYRSANEVIINDEQTQIKATYLAGNHTLTFGYELIDRFAYNLFIPYENGRWRWNSVDDFLTGNMTYMRFIKPWDNNLATAAAGAEIELESFYVEDVVDVSDILTINFGVRVDTMVTNSEIPLNPNYAAIAGFDNNLGIDSEVIQPRFGYQLDMSGAKIFSEASWIDGAELSGGVGVFQGRVPQVWYLAPFGSANGMSTVFVGHWMLGDYVTGENGFDWRDYYDGTQLHTLLDLSTMRGGAANAFAPGLTVPNDLRFAMDLTIYTSNGARLKAGLTKTNNIDAFDYYDAGTAQAGVDFYAADGRPIYNNGFSDNLYTRNTSKGGSTSITLSADKDFDNGINAFISYTNLTAESLYDSTSSQMRSNYRGESRPSALEPVMGPSKWAQEHRLIAGADYTWNEGSGYDTTLSLFYSAYSGRPYSHTYNDGPELFDRDYNVLIYVPGPNDPNVVYDGISEIEVLNHIADLGLSGFAGSIVPKRQGRAPYYRNLDLRLSQDFPGFMENDKFILYLDVMNVLNLFEEDRGIRRFKFSDQGVLEIDGWDDQGRYIITGINDDRSFIDYDDSSYRWQLGFSYEF